MLIPINGFSAQTTFVSEIDCSTFCSEAQDYTTVGAWESAMDDVGVLTAGDVMVFSHGGITGTIADAASVTGATSGATGTVIHASTTQILIDAISETQFQNGEQVRVDVSNYVTISDAGNRPIILRGDFYGESGNVTSRVVIDGLTTDNTNYGYLQVPAVRRHDGIPDTGVGSTVTSTTTGAFDISDNFFRLSWFEIHYTNSGTTTNTAAIDSVNSNNSITIDHNIIEPLNSSTGTTHGIRLRNATSTYNIFRNFIYAADSQGIAVGGASNPADNIFNNTIINSANSAIDIGDGTPATVVRNNLCLGNGTDFDSALGTTSGNCSSDTSAPSTDCDSLVAADTIVGSSAGSEDPHLKSGSTPINFATDLGTTPSDVQFDIDNYDVDTAGVTWDTGADEFVASVSSAVKVIITTWSY